MSTRRRAAKKLEREEGTEERTDDGSFRPPMPTTQLPSVHRAYVEVSMVLSPMDMVAVLERPYLEGWQTGTREAVPKDLVGGAK